MEHHHDAPKDMQEIRALLQYMIAHNDHHTGELADLLDKLPEKPRKLMLRAIGSFEAANVELSEVLAALDS